MMEGNIRKLLLFVCLMLMVTMAIQAETSMNKMFWLVTDQKTNWDAAQELCWKEKGDLASISNELENRMIRTMTKDLNISFWIGLYNDFNSWRWSQLTASSLRVQQWDVDEPNNVNSSEHCASITNSSYWRDRDCTSIKLPFFCANGFKDVLVTLEKSWSEALTYCRDLYKDLSAVPNLSKNQLLADQLQHIHLEEAWIGLYRTAWKWTDGGTSSFRQWAPNEPNNDNTEDCVAIHGNSWYDRRCDLNMSFLCQKEVEKESSKSPFQETQVQRQIFLKTKLLTGCDLTDPDIRASLFQQCKVAFQRRGFEDVNVIIRNIRKQPNQ